MNLTDHEYLIQIDAKLCGSVHQRKIAYSTIEFHHSLYINKKDMLLAQIRACELLYKYTTDIFDINVLKKEISDLKLMLDLME
ncbi:MAG TPA: hypothetical protein VK566_03475 [Nitrososphaeraceae archaeon]|jgi:hypothetical protein|nr:hypothetical protein [Nitrososphaeraceae archaeon]